MKKLDATRLVVLGEGLAAGMVNFSLFDDDQRNSFAAQLARQLNVDLPLPLIQPPGLGDAPGFPRLPVRLPFDQQTTVLCQFPPAAPPANLSVPGLTLAEARQRRPSLPIVCRDDARQTAVNFILGMPALLHGGDQPLQTQLECALQRRPTFAIVELGYAEALDAATAGNASLVPDAAAFRADYAELLKALRAANCEVLATTIPDPMDTAHFSSLDAASRVVKLPPSAIQSAYGLGSQDRITVSGLTEIGYQVIAKRTESLPADAILRGDVAAEICSRVAALNLEIIAVAREHGTETALLHGVFRRLRAQGIAVGSARLTADFLGGFYSLNGYYPGKTGHAIIANELIDVLNRTYDAGVRPIDLARAMETDAVAMYRAPEGPDFHTTAGRIAAVGYNAKFAPALIGIVGGMVAGRLRRKKEVRPPEGGSDPSRWTLKLPPGLEQVLPINTESSYYGDALRPVHTWDKGEALFGLTGKLLFGGLALVNSKLRGSVRIEFYPPVNNIAHFEVTHPGGLKGDDGKLSAPQFFQLPALQNQVMDGTESPSSGDLDLITGEVTHLQYKLFFLNSAILSLAAVNPALPKDPFAFPGQYGSTWAKFEQRPDGKLDYTSYATTFIPLSVLGVPVRFPLPFASPNGSMASIPCDGTALHPHIHVSTKAPEGAEPGVEVPVLPTNTICEFTASVHNNSLGDDFSLNAAELGGRAKGRSHLVGRFEIQFGERFGGAVSIGVRALRPGGLLTVLPQSSIAAAFKSRVPDSLLGHNEQLRFPKQIYNMDGVTYLDDPLDIAVGAVSLRTGKVIGHLLRRGMITTNWLLAMIALEDRIPKDTFPFRGPASFEKGVNGQLVFRYNGRLHLPFPEGFRFPAPDLTNTFGVGPDSALDPFLRFQAMAPPGTPVVAKSGGASRATASSGDEFSYSYAIPSGPGRASFEYTNFTKDATFRMQALTWVGCINSRSSSAPGGDYDTITFTGCGSWSKDASGALHMASVQVSTSASFPYVSILIDGGMTSNVNTKPANFAETMP